MSDINRALAAWIGVGLATAAVGLVVFVVVELGRSVAASVDWEVTNRAMTLVGVLAMGVATMAGIV